MFQLLFQGSQIGKFTKVVVSDCDTTKPYCILHRETNATIAIDFTTSKCLLS